MVSKIDKQKCIVFRHLTKLFDSIAKLKFIEAEDKPGKIASGMIAKDGEYVPFHGSCDCTGPVRNLLKKKQFVCIMLNLRSSNTYSISGRSLAQSITRYNEKYY